MAWVRVNKKKTSEYVDDVYRGHSRADARLKFLRLKLLWIDQLRGTSTAAPFLSRKRAWHVPWWMMGRRTIFFACRLRHATVVVEAHHFLRGCSLEELSTSPRHWLWRNVWKCYPMDKPMAEVNKEKYVNTRLEFRRFWVKAPRNSMANPKTVFGGKWKCYPMNNPMS